MTYLLNPVPHQGNHARETGIRKQLTFLDLTFNFLRERELDNLHWIALNENPTQGGKDRYSPFLTKIKTTIRGECALKRLYFYRY